MTDGLDLDALASEFTEITTLMPESWSDAHVGEAFAAHLAGQFRYSSALGWMQWDGTRWTPDEKEAVYEEARQWAIALTVKLAKAGAHHDDIKAAARYRDRSKMEGIVVVARRIEGIATLADEFDRDPDILVASNGVIDLRTSELTAHDPARLVTKCTLTDYIPGATHPDINATISTVDDCAVDYLQVTLGYAATAHVSEDLLIVFDGGGANGKGTVIGALTGALGDYAEPAPQKLLMRSGRDEHPAMIADLRGQRVVTVDETPEGGALRVNEAKALSGGGRMKARFMRKDWFWFEPTHQLIIATNHRPVVNSTDYAIWRRLRLVPFKHRYVAPAKAVEGDRVKDRELRNRVTTGKAQREAMLAWIVEGARRWYTAGIPDCAEIDDATDAWRRDEDVVYRFAVDRLDFHRDAVVNTQTVYDAFRVWCSFEGRPSMSLKNLKTLFEAHELYQQHHVQFHRGREGSQWRGVALRQ